MVFLSSYILLLWAIFLGVAGQILLKLGVLQLDGFNLKDILTLYRNLPLMGGFLSYGFSTLLYFQALARLDLSLAYPTVSIGYVIVVLLSHRIFNESISPARWVAIVVISIGVALVGVGVG